MWVELRANNYENRVMGKVAGGQSVVARRKFCLFLVALF
jgi:hypothetical protein